MKIYIICLLLCCLSLGAQNFGEYEALPNNITEDSALCLKKEINSRVLEIEENLTRRRISTYLLEYISCPAEIESNSDSTMLKITCTENVIGEIKKIYYVYMGRLIMVHSLEAMRCEELSGVKHCEITEEFAYYTPRKASFIETRRVTGSSISDVSTLQNLNTTELKGWTPNNTYGHTNAISHLKYVLALD